MVEIRPANIQGRKILHHSIAYHILNPDNVAAYTPLALELASQLGHIDVLVCSV